MFFYIYWVLCFYVHLILQNQPPYYEHRVLGTILIQIPQKADAETRLQMRLVYFGSTKRSILMSKLPLWAAGVIPCGLSKKSCETHLRIFLLGTGESCQEKSEIQHLKQGTVKEWAVSTAAASDFRWDQGMQVSHKGLPYPGSLEKTDAEAGITCKCVFCCTGDNSYMRTGFLLYRTVLSPFREQARSQRELMSLEATLNQ